MAELPADPDRTRIAPTPAKTPSTVAPSTRLPPEAAAVAADPSKRVGKYVIVAPIGAGGMGAVFKAFDTELGRWAALKFLTAAGDAGARAYFLREAQLAARLAHPNITAIYDVGEQTGPSFAPGGGASEGGRPFIAMQYIDGENLHAARKRMSMAQVVAAIRKTAEALKVAHDAKIIHRDLKPANIMVDSAGQVFVMDFGLAKESSVDGQSIGGSGAIVGTPSYMSPEQARGKAGPQSDIYSLGATLYDLVTGRGPFIGETVADVMTQIFSQEPVWPRKLNPSTPPDVEAIVLRCLEKEPSRRYATVDELIEDLDAYTRGDPLAHAARPGWSYVMLKRLRKQPVLWSLAAALVISVAAGAGFGAYGLVQAARAADERARVERDERAKTDAEMRKAEQRLAAIYAERGRQAFDRGDLAAAALYYAEADSIHPSAAARANASAALRGPGRLRAVLPGQSDFVLEFSPDGKLVLVVYAGGLVRLWDAATGACVHELPRQEKPVIRVAFSADGRAVATSTVDKVSVWETATGRAAGKPIPLAKRTTAILLTADGKGLLMGGDSRAIELWTVESGELAMGPIAIKSVPSRLLIVDQTAIVGCSDGTVAFVALGGTEPPILFEKSLGGAVGIMNLDPARKRLVVASDRKAQVWDVASRKPIAKPVEVGAEIVAAAFTDEGHTVVLACDDGSLRSIDAETGQLDPGEIARLAPGRQVDMHLGRRLLVKIAEDKRSARLWELSSKTPMSFLLPHEGDASGVRFAPSGDCVAVGRFSPTTRVWEVDTTCFLGRPVLKGVDAVQFVVRPDGAEIAIVGSDQVVRLWRPGAPEEDVRTLRGHAAGIRRVTYSRDGRRLFTSDAGGRAILWDPETAAKVAELAHPEAVARAAFLVDGSLLTFTKRELFRWDGRSGVALPFAESMSFDEFYRGAHSRDGGRIALVREKRRVVVVDGRTGRPLYAPLVHTEDVEMVGMSADGAFIITGAGTGGLKGWDGATGRSLKLPFSGEVEGFVFLGDASRVAVIAPGKIVRVWDLAAGGQIGKTIAVGGESSLVDVSSGGRWLLTRGEEGICVWDLVEGEQVGRPVPTTSYNVALSPQGTFLIVGSRPATLWDTSYLTDTTPTGELKRQASLRMGMKLSDDGRIEALTADEWRALRGK